MCIPLHNIFQKITNLLEVLALRVKMDCIDYFAKGEAYATLTR